MSYFATVPIAAAPELFTSIFVSSLEALMPARGVVREPGLVRMLTHDARGRTSASAFSSPLSAHALAVLEEVDDWLDDGEGGTVVRSGHKIGGEPHLIRATGELTRGIEEALSGGFSHLVQFDFPAAHDALVSGSWPFADGLFGMLGREPFGPSDWRWWWDF